MTDSDESSQGNVEVSGFDETVCEPCRKKKKLDIAAELFCTSCKEYQCRECSDARHYYSFMSGHEFIDDKNVMSLENSTNGETSQSVPDLEYEIKNLQNRINHLIRLTTETKHFAKSQLDLILENIEDMKEKLLRRCEELKESIVAKVKHSVSELTQEMNTNESIFQHISNELQLKKAYLSSARSCGNKSQMSVAVTLIKPQLTTYRKTIDQRQNKSYSLDCRFECNETLSHLLKSPNLLGLFSIIKLPFEVISPEDD